MNGENLRCCEAVEAAPTMPTVVNNISIRMNETKEILARILEVVEGAPAASGGMEAAKSLRQALEIVDEQAVTINGMAHMLLSHFDRM